MSSLTEHPIWPTLKPLIRIEDYARDGGHRHPRHRIEVLTPTREVCDELLAVEMPCVACGSVIHPIRQRHATQGRNTLFVAVTCELKVNIGCARGAAARDEYKKIVRVIRGTNGDARRVR